MVKMTRVVNLKKSPYDIYIGRGSPFGNPFEIGKDGNRDEVIAKYEAYLMGKPELLDKIPELKNKVLGCFCKPQRCHGDILARLANNLPIEDFVLESE